MKPGAPELEPENAKNISRDALVNTPLMKIFLHILWVLSFSGNYKSVCKYIAWHSFNCRTLQIYLIQCSATTVVIQIKFVQHFFLVCTSTDDTTNRTDSKSTTTTINYNYNYHVYLNRKTADDSKGPSPVQSYLRQFD